MNGFFFQNICLCSFMSLCGPMDCSPLGSSVHGLYQARRLEKVATSYSRGSSWPRHRIRVSCESCIDRWFFTTSTIWEALTRSLRKWNLRFRDVNGHADFWKDSGLASGPHLNKLTMWLPTRYPINVYASDKGKHVSNSLWIWDISQSQVCQKVTKCPF